jgi:hypothetical protein
MSHDDATRLQELLEKPADQRSASEEAEIERLRQKLSEHPPHPHDAIEPDETHRPMIKRIRGTDDMP